VDRWLAKSGREKGVVLSIEQVWRLARAWYADPRSPTWRFRTRDENQAVLASVGLTGPFWQLPG